MFLIISYCLQYFIGYGKLNQEANYAHGKADFIAKLQIALKECFETEYWLELFIKANMATQEEIKNIYNACGTIRRLLIASINTAKENQ